MTLHKITVAIAATLLTASCSQTNTVTSAPHRTTASNTVAGTVLSSYPITVSKNSGVGSVAGSIGGSIGGANIGSGTGRFVGSVLGSLIGGYTGRKAETVVREKSAQEVMINLNGKTHKIISTSQTTFNSGDKIWASTNVYGQPLAITPR